MQTIVKLQHALEVGGMSIQNVRLRDINGHDERRLADMRSSSTPVFIQSAELLRRVAAFDGLDEGLVREAINHLSIGDRVLLMLHLRRQILGDTMHCTLDCPKCGEKMSLDFSVSALVGQRKTMQPNNVVTAGGLLIEVRPATHLNQTLLLSNEGMQAFVRSCIVSCKPPLESGNTNDNAIAFAVDQKLKEIDPLADIALDLKCPACGNSFDAPFDPEAFFLDEISMRSRQLDWEVHWLAFHYHWSEESILSLGTERRRRYIDLINNSLSRGMPP